MASIFSVLMHFFGVHDWASGFDELGEYSICVVCRKKHYTKTPSIGLIEGRHPLPVAVYILNANATDLHGFHEDLYLAAFNAAKALGKKIAEGCSSVYFYPTGLSVAFAGALNGLRASGVSVTIMSYDRDADAYHEIRT